jgi:hypothetical protein
METRAYGPRRHRPGALPARSCFYVLRQTTQKCKLSAPLFCQDRHHRIYLLRPFLLQAVVRSSGIDAS